MKLSLIPEWRFQALRLWSNRFALLSALFQAGALALTAFTDTLTPKGFAVLAFVFTIGGFWARLISQDKLKEKVEVKQFEKELDRVSQRAGLSRDEILH